MSSFYVDPGKFVALIPTLMSVAGSVNIARVVQRSPAFHENCKRMLFGMSVCECISSVAFSLQSLFLPRVSSHFLWAIGNGSALGLMMQFTISSFLYNCLLSFIYLSRVQQTVHTTHRKSRDFVQTRIEPWAGAMGFAYPLLTFFIGAAMRIYSQHDFVPAINVDTAATERLREWNVAIGQHFLFPGYPLTFLAAAVVLNSLVIYSFVNYGKKYGHGDLATRTNAVATAAVLLTYLWTAILRVLESNDIRNASPSGPTGLFTLVWLQSVVLPALGLFHLGTWWYPRYRRVQTLYPFESPAWCVCRALLGEPVRPTHGWQPERSRSNNNNNGQRNRTWSASSSSQASSLVSLSPTTRGSRDTDAAFAYTPRRHCRF